jgi:hypothetical protein
MLKTLKTNHIKQLIMTTACNIEILDIRYSIDATDQLLLDLTKYKLKCLKVFLATRSRLFETLSSMQTTDRAHLMWSLKPVYLLSHHVWIMFVNTYTNASLLSIDDLTADAYGKNTKEKYLYRRFPENEKEGDFISGMPIPTNLAFSISSPKTRPLSPTASQTDSVCDAACSCVGGNTLAVCNSALPNQSSGNDMYHLTACVRSDESFDTVLYDHVHAQE